MTTQPQTQPQDGNGLGPIGQDALKSAARKRGIAPMPDAFTPASPAEQRWAEIEQLLRDQFEKDLVRLHEKALSYGSADLEVMGTAMQALLPGADLFDDKSRRAAGLEMAIGFYAMGKSARLYGAWGDGNKPGDDSWEDMEAYAKMARIVRETGRWM